MAPSGSVPAGFVSLTGTSAMRDAIYEPTADEIRAECAKIKAERLALLRERPTTTKRFATITPAALRVTRAMD